MHETDSDVSFVLTAHSGAHMEAESILINVAGRLLLFQRDRCTTSGKVPDAKEKRVGMFTDQIQLSFYDMIVICCFEWNSLAW